MRELTCTAGRHVVAAEDAATLTPGRSDECICVRCLYPWSCQLNDREVVSFAEAWQRPDAPEPQRRDR